METIKKGRSSEELRWQAESDADAMATYQEILSDKARMSRALKVAKTRATDLTRRASVMQSVAKTKTSSRKK